MTPAEARAIVDEVLRGWGEEMAAVPATPVLALCVGHGAATGGLHVWTRHDERLTPAVVAGFLRKAAALVEAGSAHR